MARKPTGKTAPVKPEMKATAINIPVETWTLLRLVAFKRAAESGERPSVSALITELAEKHRDELEREAGG